MIRSASSLSAVLLLLALSAIPAAPVSAQAGPPAKPAAYTLAGIDLFGNSRTSDADLLAMLPIKEGDEITPEVVTRLDEKLRGSGRFAYAKVSSTAYGDRKSYLTVDVVEKGEEGRFKLNSNPTGSVEVPADVLDWVKRYEKAQFQMFQVNPKRMKDINEGHYLDSDPGLREYEEKMLEMVPAHYDVLVKALREDMDPEKRALVAMLLGWAKDKKAVVAPLEEALKDPDVQVRSSAARSLIPIAYLSVHQSMPFPLDPIFDELHYPTSSDRTKAAALLLHLAGDPENRIAIRDKAGDVLVRMVSAKQPTQREHSLTLLTTISGEKYGRDPEKWRAWWSATKKGLPPPKADPPKPGVKS
jgi:HEAT repeat protein/surface antigen-like variable number repeat protein